VTIFIIVTLAYFQLLHAVAHSDFFVPLQQDAARLAAASSSSDATAVHASPLQQGGSSNGVLDKAGSAAATLIRLASREGQWTIFDSSDAEHSSAASQALNFIVEPIVLADSERTSKPRSVRALKDTFLPVVAEKLYDDLSRNSSDLAEPVRIYDADADLTAFGFGRVYTEGQYVSSRKSLLEDAGDPDLLASVLADASKAASSRLRRSPAGAVEAKALDLQAQQLSLVSVISDSDLEKHTPGGRRNTGATEELRSIRWLAYTSRALIVRFWALLQKADSADIFVMLMAYVMMHGTFVNLFLSMRKFGSNFWLGEYHCSPVISRKHSLIFIVLSTEPSTSLAQALAFWLRPFSLSSALSLLLPFWEL
jgi:hydroxymethylglutaryl-CoA reductase (NADPH)